MGLAIAASISWSGAAGGSVRVHAKASKFTTTVSVKAGRDSV